MLERMTVMEPNVNELNSLWERVAPRMGYDKWGQPAVPESNLEFPAWPGGGNSMPIPPMTEAPAVKHVLWEEVGEHCFCGGDSALADRLHELLMYETREYYVYEHLAAHARKRPIGRLYARLRDRQHKLIKRLSAVLYLMSGRQFNRPSRTDCGNLSEGLRDRYHAEARAAAGYQELSKPMSDACMRELFLETAKDKNKTSIQLMGFIEEAME